MNIKKELLVDVLLSTTEQRYFHVSEILVENDIISFFFVSDEGFNCKYEKSISSLINNYKVWAWNQGYEVMAGVDVVNVLSSGTSIFKTEPSDIDFDPMDVITACEWIYNNKVKG